MKPVWTWTHTGEQGEELCLLENKYYTKFAWDHFLAAYTGKVRPAHRDRPMGCTKFLGSGTDFSVSPMDGIDWGSLFPDEPTDPMPPPVISPGKLIASFPLKKKP